MVCPRNPGVSQMPVEIHGVVQDAHDVDGLSCHTIEQDMRAGGVFEISSPDSLRRPATPGIGGNEHNVALDISYIFFGLIFTPSTNGEIPDPGEIRLRTG